MDVMSIDQFVDTLEIELDCVDEGYIKCLEKVKQFKGNENMLWFEIKKLKAENDKLKQLEKGLPALDEALEYIIHLKQELEILTKLIEPEIV